MAAVAGLNRESVYKMLSPAGNPGLANIIDLLHACGLEIFVKPKGHLVARDHGSKFVTKADVEEIIGNVKNQLKSASRCPKRKSSTRKS